MADEQKQNPPTQQDTDISKSQSAQQPTQQPTDQEGQTGQQAPLGEQRQQSELGQDRSSDQPDQGLESDTATRQDTDIEGASQLKEQGETESGFVGSQSDSDSSSELVEDEDFAKGGQGAPEGK